MIAVKVVPAVIAGLLLTTLAACGTGSTPAAAPAATPKPAATKPAPLPCHAAMSASHPADDSTDLVHVITAGRATATAIAYYTPAGRKKTGQAGRRGHLTLRFHIGSATSGRTVQVTVTVTSGHRSGTCSTSFTLHKAPPAPAPSPPPAPPPAPTPSPAPAAPALACQASMSDASPSDYTDDDVEVTTAPYAEVSTVAYYKTTSTPESGQADGSGNASIGYYISGATVGYTVDVSVTVTAGGQSASCSTSFTPSG
jgi:hypothetical protein